MTMAVVVERDNNSQMKKKGGGGKTGRGDTAVRRLGHCGEDQQGRV